MWIIGTPFESSTAATGLTPNQNTALTPNQTAEPTVFKFDY
jgi:hypothetical protein